MKPVLAAVLLGALLGAGAARADDALAAAQRAYAGVDYPKCRDAADKALQQPADKASRIEEWKLYGLCSAALNDTDKARDAFKHMLAIDHDARLPDGLSPRFTSSFLEAKGAFLTQAPLGFTVLDEKVDRGVRTLKLKLVDEVGLVQKIAWHGKGGAEGPPVRSAPLQEIELPAEVDVTVVALDAAGGEVAVLLLPAKKPDAPKVEVKPAVVAEDKPFPWLAVGGVTAGVVVLAAAGVTAAALLAPPQAVTLKTDVVFGK